jgi:hypothetical protein
MSAKRIALIGILAVAIFIVGCSDKKTATAPNLVRVEQPTVATPMDRPNPGTDAVDIGIGKRVEFVGSMHKTEENGGCWYIHSTSGLDFATLFDKEPELWEGAYFHVDGYILEDEIADCLKIPYIQIETYYEIINAEEENRQTTLIGLLEIADGGQCSYLVTDDKTNVELDFPQYLLDDELKYGTYIEVRGYLNEDLNSECIDGPVMNVLKFHYVEELPTL